MMDKVDGLENWDLSGVVSTEQVAKVSVFVAYPPISDALVALAPTQRKSFIAQQMLADIKQVLKAELLSEWEMLKTNRRGSRYYGVSGKITMAAIEQLANIDVVQSIRVDEIEGIKKKAKKRKKPSFYCVKMIIGIQVEKRTSGLQTYEERYVLFKALSEEDARHKAMEAAAAYETPYLNADGFLVRWKVERFDDVYEVGALNGWGEFQKSEGIEVFSTLKIRKLTPDRAWHDKVE
jgi:hypothetical protein